jgi:hypothetical protein
VPSNSVFKIDLDIAGHAFSIIQIVYIWRTCILERNHGKVENHDEIHAHEIMRNRDHAIKSYNVCQNTIDKTSKVWTYHSLLGFLRSR